MKTRIISAIVAIGLAIPIFIYGGLLFNITFYFNLGRTIQTNLFVRL